MMNEQALTEKSVIKVGDVVKSHDFNGIDSCYMIGKVVSISEMDGTFRAQFVKRVFDGVENKKCKTDYFVTPLPGQLMGDGKNGFERVVVLG